MTRGQHEHKRNEMEKSQIYESREMEKTVIAL